MPKIKILPKAVRYPGKMSLFLRISEPEYRQIATLAETAGIGLATVVRQMIQHCLAEGVEAVEPPEPLEVSDAEA